MIFQTFDKGFDGWTSKIGILGTSFHDLGTAIRTSFQSARDAVRNPDSSAGFLNTFRENLGSYTFSDKEYKRNDDGDIVTSQNIDTYIPKLTKKDALQRLAELRNHQKKIQTGNAKSWSDFLSPGDAKDSYLLDLVRHTEDLSDLTGNDLVEANQKARTAVLAHNEAIKTQTLSAKASKIALQGVATAGGMIAGFLIAKGIELAVTAIDNLIHREERLAEAAKEASENIQNSFSSFQSMKQSVSSITREFAELSQHVNQATGENIDLPEEEYQRFLELSNQLAESFPNIGYTIDENGNKITGLSGSIDEITQSINNLILAQQTLTHQDISDNMEDVYKKAYEDIKKNKEEIDNLNEEKIKIQDVQEATDKLLSGDSVGFQIKTQGDSMVYSDMVGMFQRVGMKLDFREGKLSLNSTAEESELSQGELDQLKKDAQKINELITADNKSIDKKIKKHQNKIQMSKDALAPEMISWLTTDQNYSNIVQSYGGELGTAIQKHVQTLDPTDPNIKKWDRMETWITDNLLAPLYDTDNEGLRQAYTQLFTDVNLPLDSAMNYLDEIEKYYEENEISIPVIFKEQKENLKQSKKNFDERNEQFKTGNVKGLNQFFQENSIDEADEYDKWCSVTEEITDATEAMEAWKRMKKSENQPSLSFQKSWDAIGTTGSDENKQSAQEAKEQLLELAQTGKLTEKAFSNSTIATQFMIDTGLSAEEATKKINNLVESTQQLSSMKIGMTAITSAYNEKKESEDRRVSFDTLESMRNTLGIDDSWSKKDMKVWKNYTQAATDANISLKDFKKCQDDLADSYINSGNFLANLTDKNQDHYDSLLMEMGITNAHQITTKLLADSKKYLGEQDEFSAKKGKSLTDATSDEIQKFIEAEGGANKVSNALLKLAIQKELCNEHVLDFSGDCTNLLNYVKAIGGTKKEIRSLEALKAAQNHDWKKVKELGYDPSDTSLISKLTGDVEKEIKKNHKKQVKTNTTAGNKSLNTDSKNNSPSSTKETKQSFDWLERKISVLTTRIDFLKAKIEDVLSIKKKSSIIDDEIKKTNKLIKTYNKQAKFYKNKAKASAKSDQTATGEKKSKLTGKKGKKIIKQIQNGPIKGSRKKLIESYDSTTAAAIEEYQKYWDQYQNARKNKLTARKDNRELKIQKEQAWIDHHNAQSSLYDAKIENTSTAKEKNSLEDKKIRSTKKSYQRQIKVAKKTYGKKSAQVSELKEKKKKEVRDIQIEKHENLQNEAEGYRNQLNSQKEYATTAQEKNTYLAKEVQYINDSYQAQIAIAKLQKNTALQEQLKADLQKELRDNEIEQLQNLSDEQSALYALNQQREANAEGAKEKNKFEAQSMANLKAQYNYEIKIAEENNDQVEQERLRLELEEKIEESYQRQIDNIKEEYALITDLNNAKKATIDSKIAALQANGYNVSTELYEEQQKLDQENYSKTVEEINEITLKMKNLSGDALTKAETELEALKQQAWEYQKAWAETQKTINEINLSKIERVGTMLGYQSDDLDYMQTILSHSDFTPSDKETGGLTMEGLANAALTFSKMKNNNDQIANLYDQIAEKKRQLAAGEYVDNGDQLTAEINELIQKAHELEKANYDSGESIKTLVMDSLNSLADALDENISKYKDALQAQKDLYDYRRKVANQLKSIASLEKQLGALQGSDTEEARARIQKLQIQLEEEQQNLKDMEYDKYLQDQEEILNKVSEDFQDFIASVAKMSVSEICQGVGNVIADNLTEITTSISNAFTESKEISNIATSIYSLTDAIDQLQFSGRTKTWEDKDGNLHYEYTDNNGNLTHITKDNLGNVISVTENGEKVDVPNKEVSDEVEKEEQEKEKKLYWWIRGWKDNLPCYDSEVLWRLKDDPLNQFLYNKYKKMANWDQEISLINKLGMTGDPSDYQLLCDAKEKLISLGFSQGGIASQLNKIALANGDDGWATLKRGESVLTPAQTEQFRKLTENLVPLNTIAESITSLPNNPVPIRRSPASNTVVRSVDIHLDGSQVMDVETFIETLHNPKVLREVSNGVSSQVNTMMSNKLGNF